MRSEGLRIRFNRGQGQLDVELPINIKDAISTHFKDFQEYAKCQSAILSAATSKVAPQQ
jgi:hypothetical protein